MGKSLVGGNVTGDIFEGITPGAIPFSRPAIGGDAGADAGRAGVSVELGGPWSFYADFRGAHGLGHLPHPEPPEIALQAPGILLIPLWLRNQTASPIEITLNAKLPAGWTVASGEGKYSIPPHQVVAARVEINFPAVAENKPKNAELEEVAIQGTSGGQSVGVAKVRVERRKKALPQ